MIDINKLDNQYVYKLKSLVRGNDGTITNSCNFPLKNLTIDMNSNCFVCYCDGWLPIPVGKVSDFNSIEEVMSSPVAKELQNDVIQKKFTHCATDICGIKQQDKKQNVFELQINIDDSCNLSCNSCRREAIMIKQGTEFDEKVKDVKHIMSWLEKFKGEINVAMSGNGDPLASNIMRPLIKNYIPKPNQSFRIFTNGLLIKKHLATTEIFKNVKHFDISVDAGSKDVYEEVRNPGKWNNLIDNLTFLSDNATGTVMLRFAIQKRNHDDIHNFVELVEHFKFNGLIHELQDWGTWNYEPVETPDAWTIKNGTYIDHDVMLVDNPYHEKSINILKDVKSPMISLSPKLTEIINAE